LPEHHKKMSAVLRFFRGKTHSHAHADGKGEAGISPEAIPSDVWHSVLHYLSLRDLANVARVCKRLHQCVESPSVWMARCKEWRPTAQAQVDRSLFQPCRLARLECLLTRCILRDMKLGKVCTAASLTSWCNPPELCYAIWVLVRCRWSAARVALCDCRRSSKGCPCSVRAKTYTSQGPTYLK
jgi:hypothetical protein